MKRFFSAVGLCFFLLIFGLFAFLPTSQAEENVLLNLLNVPAPPPPNPLNENEAKPRPESFFSKTNPPKDDAPLADLIDYWKHQNQYNEKYTYTAKISAESLKRLLGEIEKNPEKLTEYLNVLPKNEDTAALVKRYYDQEIAARQYERGWRDMVKRWLTYNSSYFSDELARSAEAVKDVDDYVLNQEDLLALARVDWEKAQPILERLLNAQDQPVSQTLARWAFYEHALKEGDTSDIEKYRRQLQSTVENRGAGAGNRDLAMDALVEAGDFDGRDDWYLGLLSDETLFELKVGGRVYTGLTTILNHSPPEKYVAKMLELVKSDNQAVRNAAVRNLTTLLPAKNPEIVRALVPWLENPNWAKEIGGERRTIAGILESVVVPESVPGLIAMLNEKEVREFTAPISPNSNSAPVMKQLEYYPHRYAAINALATQKDARAVPALRLILPQVEEYEQRMVVRSLLFCGGYSVSEQVDALEFVARTFNQQIKEAETVNTNSAVMSNINAPRRMRHQPIEEEEEEEETEDESPPVSYSRPDIDVIESNTAATYTTLNDLKKDSRVALGLQLAVYTEPGDELVAALLERIESLDAKEPGIAASLRKIMQNWKGAAVNSMHLKDLKNNKLDADGIVKLLSVRAALKEKQLGEVYELRNGGAIAYGISACLTGENSDYDAILAGEGVESKIAMLGCARLIRARLPVRDVAKNLNSPNKLLALAAERYLESEDSPEARALVLARHPNEAVVLGARTAFYVAASNAAYQVFLRELFASVDESLGGMSLYYEGGDFEALRATEKKLQKEVRENQELLGVYAYTDNFIRIYKDKAVFSWEEDVSRYRERVLSKEEFDAFKGYLASQKVDELPPFLSGCVRCDSKELLMLGRGGGRRVFVRTSELPRFFAGLENMFDEMRKPPARLRYWLQKDIGALEVLFEDENLHARAVWKNGGDFRVLIENEARREQIDKELERQEEDFADAPDYDYEKAQQIITQRREQRKYENYGWHKFEASKLSGLIAQPPGVEFIPARDGLPADDGSERLWKARTANFEVRADEEGLYKIAGGRATKIRAGYYSRPLTTANARWAIVTKYDEEEPSSLVRVNLTTGREFKIKIEQYPSYEAVAFIPSLNKALVFGGTYRDEEYTADVETKEVRYGDYFLLDAETGLVQEVGKKEIRPLAQQTFRPLQPTGKPDEFWAAIPNEKKNNTQIGFYNTKTLAFKSIIKLPEIFFDSMNMWIDDKEQKIYFVYSGHLLALPLPKQSEEIKPRRSAGQE